MPKLLVMYRQDEAVCCNQFCMDRESITAFAQTYGMTPAGTCSAIKYVAPHKRQAQGHVKFREVHRRGSNPKEEPDEQELDCWYSETIG